MIRVEPLSLIVYRRALPLLTLVSVLLASSQVVYAESAMDAHPRLYFNQAELTNLRSLRADGVHAQIWQNMIAAAEWCQQQELRREWIPTLQEDPLYENLYDRFYAAMHDTAIVEHLALTSALSDPTTDRFFNAARQWTLAAAKVWRNEANNSPDASKAYAVLRIMKALAVAYDALYDRLSDSQRQEIRQTIFEAGQAYMRASYRPGDMVVGLKKGGLVVHAGGVPVLVDQLGVEDINDPKAAVEQTTLNDDGSRATIRCIGPQSAGLGEQTVALQRPGKLTIDRQSSQPLSWWYSGLAERKNNAWTWSSGTRLEIVRGTVMATTPAGYIEAKTHYGGMKFADPHPNAYPTITVEPVEGRITVVVTRPDPVALP